MGKNDFIVAFDDIALQMGDSGIARYWRELTSKLVALEILEELRIKPIFLSRSSFRTPSLKNHLDFPSYDFQFPAADRQMISAFCKSEKVDLFVSSHYTFSTNTRNLPIIYDLIPEVYGFRRMNRTWMERELAIHSASAFITISQHTKNDLIKFYPHAKDSHIGIAYPGINSSLFTKSNMSQEDGNIPKKRYFVCVGSRYGQNGYKNGKLLVDAVNLIDNSKIDFDLHFIGGEPLTQEELSLLNSKNLDIHTGRLDDSGLVQVLQNAEALVYPSKYEGFGMPLLEALSVGTPVITTNHSAIPEVVGDLAVFADSNDAQGLADILLTTNFRGIRESIFDAGPLRASQFSWEQTAKEFAATLKIALTSEPTVEWKKRQEILSEYSKIAINLQR